MQGLRYLTQESLDRLIASRKPNLENYGAAYDWKGYLGAGFERIAESIEVDEDLIAEVRERDDDSDYDTENSLTVYAALKGLTPERAADYRIWVHLCHIDLNSYVRSRWIKGGPNEESVRNHFFGSGSRDLMRNNGVSRLWWMGFVAHHVANRIELSAEEILEVLLFRDDVRQNVLDRTGISASWEGLAALLEILNESYQGSQSLFVRSKPASNSPIRRLMRRINAYSGIIVWDVCSIPDLVSRFHSIAYSELEIPPP